MKIRKKILIFFLVSLCIPFLLLAGGYYLYLQSKFTNLYLVILSVFFILLIIFFFFYNIQKLITAPLEKLSLAIKTNDQQYIEKLQESNDEFGEMARHFNHFFDANEHKLRILYTGIDQSADSMVITDVDGKIEYVNQQFTKITGYTFEEAIAQNPRILKSGNNGPEFYKNLWDTILSGQVWEGEFLNRKKNGELYWEMAHITPIKNKQGIISHFFATKLDITSRKKLEMELSESYEHYKMLSDLSTEGIVIRDNEQVLDINKSFSRIFAYPENEIFDYEALHKIFTPESAQIIKEYTKLEYTEPYEVTGIRIDGSEFPVEIQAKYFMYKNKRVRAAAVRDISNRKKMEDVLSTSLKLTPLLSTYSEKEIIEWSLEQAVRMTGSTSGFFHFISDDQETILLQSWSANTLKYCNSNNYGVHYPIKEAGTWVDCVYAKKPVIHNDYQSLEHKKGMPEGHFPLTRYLTVPVMEDDKVKVIFGVGNKPEDYSQFDADALSLFGQNIWRVILRKRIEEELRQANATKNKFFSIISHDLRSPFAALLGFTEVIYEQAESLDIRSMKKMFEIVHNSAKNTFELLENLLEWSRSQTGQIPYKPDKYHLNKIIEESIKGVRQQADNKNQKIFFSPTNEIKVLADWNLLLFVLRNLMTNAIKFSYWKTTINIEAKVLNGLAEVSVKDNGIGIEKDEIDKLFKIEYKISRPGTDNEPSTGLGLILCQEFIEKQGGKISVESTPGKGSTFKFTLPMVN